MYADALAISRIAQLAGKPGIEEQFQEKALRLKTLVQERLWDPKDEFFKCIPLPTQDSLLTTWNFQDMPPDHNVREQIGFLPWAFNLPDRGYEAAWRQLMDPHGFAAPYGPTTAEQRHPRFMFRHDAHECLWNGPSWPFSTCQTLMGMANLLANDDQTVVDRQDYLRLLKIYAGSHYRRLADGRVVNWLDENLDPFTGEWLSRSMLENWGWRAEKGGRERGKDYNHSTFCDLIISGLVGFQPGEGDAFTVKPLVPDGVWDYYSLDHLTYHGKKITVLYDRSGERYGRGKGLRVLVDDQPVAEE
jgi:hypothetical protein